jgi:COMPASS component BRE2
MAREKRAKKESLKKRESKGAVSWADGPREAPDAKQNKAALPSEVSPHRYISVPKPSHFEPSRGPVFTGHHGVSGPDGTSIEFMETSDQFVMSEKGWRASGLMGPVSTTNETSSTRLV